MQEKVIQWFPGHMAVARRLIRENLSDVDIILEVLDARIPKSSRNPEIEKILGDKKSVVILNKADLADETRTAFWKNEYSATNRVAIAVDSKNGKGTAEILAACRTLLKDKLDRNREKGVTKPIRAMVVGIPNVGKSTLINRFAGAKKAAAENRPGVTKTKQWVRAGKELELLDMPGVLWPKFDDRITGENLAMTGAIKDQILDPVEIAVLLCGRLRERYPVFVASRFRLPDPLPEDAYDLFCLIGKKRGMLQSKGSVNEERTAAMLLDEFRSGVIGRISLE